MRITSGYRTISTVAIQVIAGVPPISLLIEERASLYRKGNSIAPKTRNQKRIKTLSAWHEEWEKLDNTAKWAKLIHIKEK